MRMTPSTASTTAAEIRPTIIQVCCCCERRRRDAGSRVPSPMSSVGCALGAGPGVAGPTEICACWVSPDPLSPNGLALGSTRRRPRDWTLESPVPLTVGRFPSVCVSEDCLVAPGLTSLELEWSGFEPGPFCRKWGSDPPRCRRLRTTLPPPTPAIFPDEAPLPEVDESPTDSP